jgi:hypothetical protein
MKRISRLAWMPLSCLLLAGLANAQTIEEVGDPDSFGRDVTYLGLASVDPFYLQADCAPVIAAGFECLVPVQGQTLEFSSSIVDSIQLPSRASNSLLCFALSPSTNRRFVNSTTSNQLALLVTRALLTIESSVLQDPALIDPTTDLPFNGKISLTLVTNNENRRILPGDFDTQVSQLSRSCQGALVSKRALMQTYGLTQSQANSFFNNRITVKIGMSGAARFIDGLVHGVGLRLYGDRR